MAAGCSVVVRGAASRSAGRGADAAEKEKRDEASETTDRATWPLPRGPQVTCAVSHARAPRDRRFAPAAAAPPKAGRGPAVHVTGGHGRTHGALCRCGRSAPWRPRSVGTRPCPRVSGASGPAVRHSAERPGAPADPRGAPHTLGRPGLPPATCLRRTPGHDRDARRGSRHFFSLFLSTPFSRRLLLRRLRRRRRLCRRRSIAVRRLRQRHGNAGRPPARPSNDSAAAAATIEAETACHVWGEHKARTAKGSHARWTTLAGGEQREANGPRDRLGPASCVL